MGFKITRDYVHNTEELRQWKKTGKTYGNYKGGNHKFRLIDEDGDVYFHGVSDNSSSFAPLDWAEQWGYLIIEYKENGEWRML